LRARGLDKNLEMLYRIISWPLARKFGNAIAPTYEAFSILVHDSYEDEGMRKTILNDLGQKLDKEVINVLINILRKGIILKIPQKKFEDSSKLELRCTAYEGVETIKNAMRAAVEVSNERAKVEIWRTAPYYILKTNSSEKEICDLIHEQAIQACKTEIETFNGSMSRKS